MIVIHQGSRETGIGGPAWKTVVTRTTYDLTDGNNQIIAHISTDKGAREANLYRKLQLKASEIRTILQYKEESDKKSVKNPKDSEKKGCGVLEVWTNWASGKATYLGK